MTAFEAGLPAAALEGDRRSRAGALQRAGWLVLLLLVLVGVPGCWWLAGHAEPHRVLHEGALFVHLASLVLGFGAVLTVDWVGLLWLLGRRAFEDVTTAAGNVTFPIWAGYAGLVGSGLLLEPDLGARLTQVKIALVLLIGLNGLVATALHRRLADGPSLRLVAISSTTALLSQIGWWGAVVIGHLTTR